MSSDPRAPRDELDFARRILATEADALRAVADSLGGAFLRAVDLLEGCTGAVVVSGIGKAGLVGRKIAATLASTGAPSHFLHPAEAIHGDLGVLRGDDVLLVLSFSGESEEIVRLLPCLAATGLPLLAITGRPDSALGRAATTTLDLGPLEEACPLGLAPSTSTTAMLALGDALALTLSRRRAFTREVFAKLHPGGSLGRRLARVVEAMRPLDRCRVGRDVRTVREVLVDVSLPGRRTGAVMLVDATGRLSGLFTDSDLARLLESKRDADLDAPISRVMTRRPQTVRSDARMSDAVALISERRISELPVVDDDGRPAGLIDLTDLAPWLSPALGAATPTGAATTGAATPSEEPERKSRAA